MDGSTTSPAPGRPRLDGVDVLRGLSVLLVVLHHINLRFQLNHFDVAQLLPRFWARVLFWSGYYSVIVFFVISGFLITNLSLRRWGELAQLRVGEFYRLRVARIAPCLLLLLGTLCLLHLSGQADYQIDPQKASLGRAVLAALGLHINWLEGTRGYLPGNWDVLWSLSIEETFYLAFPLLCVWLRDRRLLIVCLLSLIVIGPVNRTLLAGQEPWDDYAYLSCMDGIAFGCLAALIVARRRLPRPTLRLLLLLGALCAALIVVFRAQAATLGLPDYGLNVTLLELGIALMLVALGSDVGNSVLGTGTRLLRVVGRCSYEIYLSHMFVVFVAVQLFKASGQSLSVIGWWYGAMLLGSGLLGWLIARLFSEPANRSLRQQWVDQGV